MSPFSPEVRKRWADRLRLAADAFERGDDGTAGDMLLAVGMEMAGASGHTPSEAFRASAARAEAFEIAAATKVKA